MADNLFGKQINWDEAARFGAGAVDELLWGIPEFALKQIDRAAVQNWINKNPGAYHLGEFGGTVGSIATGGLLAKALGGAVKAGKAAKAIDTAADIAKAADTASDVAKGGKYLAGLKDILGLSAKGALAGAAESGVRGITSEKSLDQILKDIQTGAMWGGVGGAAGGLIAKKLPSATRSAEKYAEQQYLRGRGINTKALKQSFMQSMPKGAGDAYKAQKAGEYLRDFTDFAKTVPRGEGVVEEMAKQTSDMYKLLDKAWGGKMGNATAADVIKGIIHPDDISRLAEEYGDDAAKGAVEFVTSQASGKQGLVGIKKYFERVGDVARTNPKIAENVQLSAAIQDLAYGLKDKADDIAMAAAEGQGINIAELRRKYKYLKPFEKAEVAQTLALGGPGGGSPTFEKRSVAELASALGAPAVGAAIGGGTAALSPEEGKKKLENIILGSLGGAAITKGLSAGSSRALGALVPVASKAAEKIGTIAPEVMARYGAAAGGQAASIIARNAVKEAAPDTPKEESAAQAGATAGAGDTPAYISQIMDRMKMYAQIKGVKVDSPEFAQFAQQVYQVTNGFAPDKIAGILYPDEGERAAYLKALSAAQRLSQTLPGALAEKPGFLQSESEEATIGRQSAIDQLAAVVGDAAKAMGSEKAAKDQLNKILGSRKTPEEKTTLIKYLLAQYGVDVDRLAAMGVV